MPTLFSKSISIIQIGLLLTGLFSMDSNSKIEFEYESKINVETIYNIYNDQLPMIKKDFKTVSTKEVKHTEIPINIQPVQDDKPKLSNDEIDLIAIVTMAEAESEPEYGQRLVIDTILDRVDSKYFPNNVHDVVYQKNQFTSMWNGRAKRCEVRQNIRQLVLEELKSRTNSNVMFFTEGYYPDYGKPMFVVGGHYFSSYN